MTAILRTADTTCRQAGTGTLPQAHRGQETDTRQIEQLKAENALEWTGKLQAMPFLRFAGHSVKTRGVFPQGHRKCQSAIPYLFPLEP